MWRKWLPWRFFIRTLAQKHGFLDPIAFFSKIEGFGQPSEVALPIEIIRLGAVLTARGSLNVVAIQHNLDWNWPYWVVRQFNPKDNSFIPRAFALTHINLTHRNWTGLGLPDSPDYPIVDPRGLLTPFLDSWSVDAWVIQGKEKENLIPSHLETVSQTWKTEGNPEIVTESRHHHLTLRCRTKIEKTADGAYCSMTAEAESEAPAWLVLTVRPFNPEGVSEISHISLQDQELAFEVNKKHRIYFSEAADRHYFSKFSEGDVYRKIIASLQHPEEINEEVSISCPSGMATAAALFRIPEKGRRCVEMQIPLYTPSLLRSVTRHFVEKPGNAAEEQWNKALENHCVLNIQDKKTQELYDQAVRTLILYSPGVEVFPGPYTYKHFWFRDAAFILNALLSANLVSRAEKVLDHFPARQRLTGYFCSQDGEWDSNGQALWIYRRFCELTGTLPKASWKESIQKGAAWIEKKRLSKDKTSPHAGLLPAGFSAEHLGPNDFYYWDDFWGVEGCVSAALLLKQYGEQKEAEHYEKEAALFAACIDRSLAFCENRLNTKAMPASPYRRLDTGAIGSLTVGYPINAWEPADPRVMETVEYLLKNHFLHEGFFHDMSHSGINPYLTLTVAQILLRNHDARYAGIIRGLQKMASPTGQWPEAVHPHTMGGCMGDGQHVWAAAEWFLMIRNCFVNEEPGRLIFCSGLLPEWYQDTEEVFFGKTRTPHGLVSLKVRRRAAFVEVSWEAEWFGEAPEIEVRLPGYLSVTVKERENCVKLTKEKHA